MQIAIAALIFLCTWIHGSSGQGSKIEALFVFGDSYVDVGNLVLTRAWNKPYGISWPGYPTGRYSNGRVQTDFLAAYMGLPSPSNLIQVNIASWKKGINFSVAGSGVTMAYGLSPLSWQVSQLATIASTGYYSKDSLEKSLAIICEAGNDYGANKDAIKKDFQPLVTTVVNGITESIKRLYDLGLRNMIVFDAPPFGCLPLNTMDSNHTSCNTDTDNLTIMHNQLLKSSIQQLMRNLTGAHIIFLEQSKAFRQLLGSSSGFSRTLKPCCEGISSTNECGDFDLLGKKLYTVCDNPDSAVYWDHVHPTEAGYRAAVNLYLFHQGFVEFSPTLSSWLSNLPQS